VYQRLYPQNQNQKPKPDNIEVGEFMDSEGCASDQYCKIMKLNPGFLYDRQYTHVGYKKVNNPRFAYCYAIVDTDGQIISERNDLITKPTKNILDFCTKYYDSRVINGTEGSSISPFTIAEQEIDYLYNKMRANAELTEYYEILEITSGRSFILKLKPGFKFAKYLFVKDIITVSKSNVHKIVEANAISIGSNVGEARDASLNLKYVFLDPSVDLGASVNLVDIYHNNLGPEQPTICFHSVDVIITTLLCLIGVSNTK